jgi:hypothetical protein
MNGTESMLHDPPPDAAAERAPFVILRRTGLYVALTASAFVLALGFAWFAYDRSEPLLWIPVAVLGGLGLLTLPGAGDVRTPLFVADDHGVRMRHREGWIGLLWNEMAEIVVEPRTGRHDPRVKVVSLDGLHVYSAPVGFATNVSVAEAEAALARRRPPAAY